MVKDPYGNIQGAVFETLASLAGRLSVINRGVVVRFSISLEVTILITVLVCRRHASA